MDFVSVAVVRPSREKESACFALEHNLFRLGKSADSRGSVWSESQSSDTLETFSPTLYI